MRTVRQPALAYRYGTPQRTGGVARALARVESLAFLLWVLVLVGISGGLLWARSAVSDIDWIGFMLSLNFYRHCFLCSLIMMERTKHHHVFWPKMMLV